MEIKALSLQYLGSKRVIQIKCKDMAQHDETVKRLNSVGIDVEYRRFGK